jgi:hypothetical protein
VQLLVAGDHGSRLSGQAASGKRVADGLGSDTEAKPTTAQTAEDIADWCSQSPTIGVTIDQTGYSKQQHVDFGGNYESGFLNLRPICEWILSLFGYEDDCYK